jgi:phage gp29-like protein
MGRLDPRDDAMIEHGGQYRAYDVYQRIQRDPHVYAVLQKRISAVICREWEVEPASESRKDKKAADLVTDFLENLASYSKGEDPNETFVSVAGGFDNVCGDLMHAIFYGMSFAEVMWDQGAKGIYPREIKACDVRRFGFVGDDKGTRLRLLTPYDPYNGEPLPPKKIIYHRFSVGNLHPDPYGVGLAVQLFYPQYFKRNAVKFWLIFADKWATPTAVGKYGVDTTESEKDELLNLLESIATDSGLVIPQSMTVEFLEAQRSSTVSTYESLINFCNNEISKAVLGETGTTDQSSGGGSRARDQIGNEVRLEIAKTDADMLSMTLNRTLCRWITELNVPGANPPKIWRKYPELDDKFYRQAEAGIISTDRKRVV